MGLLLLRMAVAITTILEGHCYLAENGHGFLVGKAVGIGFILSALALAVGFLTPLGSIVVSILVLGTATGWIATHAGCLFDTPLHTALTLVIAISVTILGPGAYSADARLFGRREIILPRLPPTS
jgi:uncharacterized membrane protein YphA (DoxX/SURF4 family)